VGAVGARLTSQPSFIVHRSSFVIRRSSFVVRRSSFVVRKSPMTNDPTTLYIIAYDISADRRRTKVHRLLCGYGAWTQYSLFECWLTRRQLIELQAKLLKLLDREADSVRFYPLCAGCRAKVVTVGGPRPSDPAALIL
jgi:CRISPR-associated protein Cas2